MDSEDQKIWEDYYEGLPDTLDGLRKLVGDRYDANRRVIDEEGADELDALELSDFIGELRDAIDKVAAHESNDVAAAIKLIVGFATKMNKIARANQKMVQAIGDFEDTLKGAARSLRATAGEYL
jgi:hypothetical protein